MDPAPLLRLHLLRGQAQEGNWRADGQCQPGKAVPETITDGLFSCVCFFPFFPVGRLRYAAVPNSYILKQRLSSVYICQNLSNIVDIQFFLSKIKEVPPLHTVPLGAGTSWYDELWRGRKHAPAGLDDEPLVVLFDLYEFWNAICSYMFTIWYVLAHSEHRSYVFNKKMTKIQSTQKDLDYCGHYGVHMSIPPFLIFSPLSQLGFRHGFAPSICLESAQ